MAYLSFIAAKSHPVIYRGFYRNEFFIENKFLQLKKNRTRDRVFQKSILLTVHPNRFQESVEVKNTDIHILTININRDV